MWSGISPMGRGRDTSHIDYVRQTSRRLNTTRQIHQDTTRLSKHTCTPVDSHSPPPRRRSSADRHGHGPRDSAQDATQWGLLSGCCLRLLSPDESYDIINCVEWYLSPMQMVSLLWGGFQTFKLRALLARPRRRTAGKNAVGSEGKVK